MESVVPQNFSQNFATTDVTKYNWWKKKMVGSCVSDG